MTQNDAPAPGALAQELARLLEDLTHQPLPSPTLATASRALTLARQLAQQLNDTPIAQEFDHATFDQLIALAGPETGPALLAQVIEDLSAIDRALALALPAADWPTLRAQSHVMLSIAGSLGATRLYTMAEALNHAAHDHDAPSLAHLSPAITGALSRTLAFVRAHPDCPATEGQDRPDPRG